MSDDITTKIAELEASLRIPGLPVTAREALEQQLAILRAQITQQQSGGANLGVGNTIGQTGDIVAGDQARGTVDNQGRIAGAAVGINYGTIQAFFGAQPPANAQELLAAYLDALLDECAQLRLYRLVGRRQTGAEQGSVPPLRLQAVYTSLTTDGPPLVLHERQRTARQARALLARLDRRPCTPDLVPPEQVRMPHLERPGAVGESPQRWDWEGLRVGQRELPDQDDDTPLILHLTRSELATEAIRANRRLVLLGEPGAGKSTVLRYLALLLAQRLRSSTADLADWPATDLPIPILCPLGMVASAMARHGSDATTALWQVLGDLLDGTQPLRAGLRAHLTEAIRDGGVLLLFDGLDELPAGSAGAPGPRQQIAAALRTLAAAAPRSRMVVTARVLPYQAPGDWKLRPEEGWVVRTIQPLAFGQVRTFVTSWYTALTTADPTLAETEAAERADTLIAELEQYARIRPLVSSPLLLTMLAILHYNTDEVPRDRARLYHECVQLLLERWEPVRTPGLERLGLLARLGNIPGLDLDVLRGVLHELAFRAHDRPPGDDGRGLLDGDAITGRMLRFFQQVRSADPAAQVATFLEVLHDDAGLLQARADNGYAFPHLTFQEYLAACYLADQPALADLAYQRWHGADAERWREVLLLLIGRLRQQGAKAVERDGLPWLLRLVGSRLSGYDKDPLRRGRDAVLAALSYAELGGRAAFANSALDVEMLIEAPLRQAIVDLLRAPLAPLPLTDRIAAARVLGDLGDPRVPVTPDQWRAELARRNEQFGAPSGYWCYVRGSAYGIGGWEQDEQAADITLPPYWIARFPITVAQYARFVAEGYGDDAERWWTPNGRQWKKEQSRTQPWVWNEAPYDGANQPVIGVTWYEATAFCAWLSVQLVDTLPAGYVVRLPTEAEWEAATAYDAAMQRRPYSWGLDDPTPERAIYNQSNLRHPAPVGCCPSGAAACGALDLAGNVWEMTTSRYWGYPRSSNGEVKDFTTDTPDVPWRGGSYYQNSTSVHCGARVRYLPVGVDYVFGFRVVCAPRSH